jgi:hypothetical protein
MLMFIVLFAGTMLTSCEKCTTCKIANDGSGKEKVFPEYCTRNKKDMQSFKDAVKKEADEKFVAWSCNDK